MRITDRAHELTTAGKDVGLDRMAGERVSSVIRHWLLSGDPQIAIGTQAAPPAGASV